MGQTSRQLRAPRPLGKRQSVSFLLAEDAAEAASEAWGLPRGTLTGSGTEGTGRGGIWKCRVHRAYASNLISGSPKHLFPFYENPTSR